MAKVKLTKNELKKQKDSLKRFERYLPTLMLKKQQLQMMIRQVEAAVMEKQAERDKTFDDISQWIEVFGEESDLDAMIKVESVDVDTGNIAGIDIPVFKNILFFPVEYDLFYTPPWIDRAVKVLKELITQDIEIGILKKQQELLNNELRITSQRVNLFEKVKIPETKENIKKIQIYLGDQQTAAVVRGKIAKNSLVEVGGA
jgi:V/A-type H+/Na+-transporting ATPase subunit D